MASSQLTELAAQLQANSIQKGLQKEELLKRLKRLSLLLAQHKQKPIKEIDVVANDLVDPFISTHRAAEVRLLAACCLSDIFKIYVPQPPFQDKQCKQVFHNFIDHLHGLRDPASPSIPRCQYLLENLAKVNTFLYVCVDENMDENILQKLFELSFLILKQNSNSTVEYHLFEILSSCIEELSVVPQSLVDVLLKQLCSSFDLFAASSATSENSSFSSASTGDANGACGFEMVFKLIKKCEKILEPLIRTMLVDGFVKKAEIEGSDFEDRKDFGEVIVNLIMRYPKIFAHLAREIAESFESENTDTRKESVALFSKIFSHPRFGYVCTQELTNIWTHFLKRFNDVDIGIRVDMCSCANSLLLVHSDVTFMNTASSGPADTTSPAPEPSAALVALWDTLLQRLLDKDEKVRKATVDSIMTAGISAPESISIQLLQGVSKRTVDKKYSVRFCALEGLAKSFKQHCTMYWKNGLPLPKECKKFSWIPRRVIACVDKEPMLVEELMDKVFLGSDADRLSADERTRVLIGIYASLDSKTKQSFQQLVQGKQVVQAVVKDMLDAASVLKKAQSQVAAGAGIAAMMKGKGSESSSPAVQGPLPAQAQQTFNHKVEIVAKKLAPMVEPAITEGDTSSTSSASNAESLSTDTYHYERALDFVKLVGVHKDNNIRKWLLTLSDPLTQLSTQLSAADALSRSLYQIESGLELSKPHSRKKFGKDADEDEVITSANIIGSGKKDRVLTHRLLSRLSGGIFPVESSKMVLKEVAVNMENGRFPLAQAALELLSYMVELYPSLSKNMFGDYLDIIHAAEDIFSSSASGQHNFDQNQKDARKKEEQSFMMQMVTILSHSSDRGNQVDEDVKDGLTTFLKSFAFGDDCATSESAIRAIRNLYIVPSQASGGGANSVDISADGSGLLQDILKEMVQFLKSQRSSRYISRLPSVLSALGQLANLVPFLFDKEKSAILTSVKKLLTSSPSDYLENMRISGSSSPSSRNGEKESDNDGDKNTIVIAKAKVAAVKLLSIYAYSVCAATKAGSMHKGSSPSGTLSNVLPYLQTLCSFIRADGLGDTSRGDETDIREQLRHAAVLEAGKGVISLCSFKEIEDFLFSPDQVLVSNAFGEEVVDLTFSCGNEMFRHLAFLAHHESFFVRSEFINFVIQRIIAPQGLSFKFSVIVALAGSDKELKPNAKRILPQLISRQRSYVARRRLALLNDPRFKSSGILPVHDAVLNADLPEYCLATLVHMLSYHPDFDSEDEHFAKATIGKDDNAKKELVETYAYFAIFIRFYLELLVSGASGAQYGLLLNIIQAVKNSVDVCTESAAAVTASSSSSSSSSASAGAPAIKENSKMYKLVEIADMELRSLWEGKSWKNQSETSLVKLIPVFRARETPGYVRYLPSFYNPHGFANLGQGGVGSSKHAVSSPVKKVSSSSSTLTVSSPSAVNQKQLDQKARAKPASSLTEKQATKATKKRTGSVKEKENVVAQRTRIPRGAKDVASAKLRAMDDEENDDDEDGDEDGHEIASEGEGDDEEDEVVTSLADEEALFDIDRKLGSSRGVINSVKRKQQISSSVSSSQSNLEGNARVSTTEESPKKRSRTMLK